MVIACFFGIFPLIAITAGAVARVASTVSNNRDSSGRLRYTVNSDGEIPATDIGRLTAFLPETPFIKNVVNSDRKIFEAKQGDSIELRCEVVGMPSPIVYWTKNGQPLSNVGSNRAKSAPNVVELVANDGRPSLETAITAAKLPLHCLSTADAGVYQCVGDNGVGKVISEARVIVTNSNEDGSSRCQSADTGRDSPSIIMHTDMRMEYAGNNVQLNCRADGQPKPVVRWYDSDDNFVRDGGNFTILPNGDLLIKRLNFGEELPFRQFTCRASNVAGTDEAAIGILAMKPSD